MFSGVFNGHAHQVARLVQIHVDILRDFPGLFDGVSGELKERRIRILEVRDFHI